MIYPNALWLRVQYCILKASACFLLVSRCLFPYSPAQVDCLEAAAMLHAELTELWEDILLKRISLFLQVAEG